MTDEREAIRNLCWHILHDKIRHDGETAQPIFDLLEMLLRRLDRLELGTFSIDERQTKNELRPTPPPGRAHFRKADEILRNPSRRPSKPPPSKPASKPPPSSKHPSSRPTKPPKA
jgi:hypothetical protein